MSKVNLDLNQMFEAGVHFGHFKRRWHPNMSNFIHSIHNGRCIIDLTATKQALEEILPIITAAVSQGNKVLMVGTKRQTKSLIEETASALSMPYVTNRWVGGMLTNNATINIRIKKLKDLEQKMASGELVSKYNKLEVQNYQKTIDNLNRLYGGIKEMNKLPGLVFITDMQTNAIAVTEANKLNIPIVALADTNVDPTLATYPIPANDDALRSLELIINLISEAIKTGQNQLSKSVESEADEQEVVNQSKEV
ncbi:MAG: 30S ribosomal protein S2 [Candidatus Saccharibacteria bacterium]|nr:30S ribosomal protein S2 [Candidatus Saccharibacteria bacterium]